jgi:hypothetical protein
LLPRGYLKAQRLAQNGLFSAKSNVEAPLIINHSTSVLLRFSGVKKLERMGVVERGSRAVTVRSLLLGKGLDCGDDRYSTMSVQAALS